MEEKERKSPASEPQAEENDLGVREMMRALKAQEDFENAMDQGQFKLRDMAIIKPFLPYVRPYIWKFLFALLLDVFITLGFVFLPRIQGLIINYLSQADVPLAELNFGPIGMYCGIYAAIVVVVIVAIYFNGITFYTLGQEIVTKIRDDLFAHVESLSLAQINALPVGKYITRITNDCRGLSSFFTDMVVNFARDVLSIAMTGAMAFFISWKLALIFVGMLPIVFFLSFYFRRRVRPYFRQQRRQRSEINGFLSESISGMRTIKAFDRESEKAAEFERRNDNLRKAYLRQIDIFSFYQPLMFFLQMTAAVLVIGFGVGYVIPAGDIVVGTGQPFIAGDLYNMYGYTGSFFSPIQEMAELFNNLQNVLTSAERVSALLSVKPSVEDAPDAQPIEALERNNPIALANPQIVSPVKGDIVFEHVWFAYVGEEWVLKDVSFHVRPGETAAFVGATGAGKSTIIGLIVRNIIPQKGRILIDGIDISTVTIESLRANISQMMQDVFLFSGTIADNITLFDEQVDRDRLRRAVRTVGAEPFILALPGGYDSPVLERGNNFSVGQRQLISFARAVYHRPSVMVLDEATANIDTETEVVIQSSLKRLRTLGTMVIVAHRLSTIKDADCIHVVDQGRIVETGTHDELIAMRGTYYDMYRLQNLERELRDLEVAPQPAKI